MKIALPLITLAVAFLMVSRFRYSHVANRWLRGQKTRLQLIQAVFAVAFVFLVRELAVPLILCWFAFASPLRAAWTRVSARRLYKSRRI
jgi:CDP-diacylglycerol--serine O-phosphatidyltransferase